MGYLIVAAWVALCNFMNVADDDRNDCDASIVYNIISSSDGSFDQCHCEG